MTPNDVRIINAALEATRPVGLVGYVLNRKPLYGLPEMQGAMFDYVLGADGLYLHAKRENLEVCFQVAPAQVRGLAECFEDFAFDLPKVPENLVAEILAVSNRYAQESLETLFWLEHSRLNPWNDGWLIHEPAQKRRPASCRPDDGQDDLYQRVMIEIHSHHGMRATPSATDDADERGFRLYGVIGNLPGEPEIWLRAGVYGQFWDIPASWALELPDELRDRNPDPEEEPTDEELMDAIRAIGEES